jgi:hypothetical protein
MKIIQKYNDDLGTFVIKPELNDRHTLREFAIALIIASYDLAVPFGLGFYRDHKSEMTEELAIKMLEGVDISHDYGDYNPNKHNEVAMDYVNGRCCKTYIILHETDAIQCIDLRISTVDREPKKIIEYALQLLRMKDE